MNITIKNVILSYPHLFKMWAGQPSHTPKFSAEYIFPEGSDTAVAEVAGAIEAAAKEKWPTNTPEYTLPWKQVKDGPYAGCWAINAKDGESQPPIVDQNRQEVLDNRAIFAGCKVHASVSFYATNNGGTNRVAVGLGPIMIVDNSDAMPRLSQKGISAQEAFKDIEGAPAPLDKPAGATAGSTAGGPGGPGNSGAVRPGAPQTGPTGPNPLNS